MNKFKAGDKVIFKNKSKWKYHYAEISEGDVFIVDESDNCLHKIIYYVTRDNKYIGESIFEEDLEKFIEPKYKVGLKFNRDVLGRKVPCEIVAVKLNKKLGRIIYLGFDLEDGYVGTYSEEYITSNTIINKPKKLLVEMTLSQVCEKLGQNIKIIK